MGNETIGPTVCAHVILKPIFSVGCTPLRYDLYLPKEHIYAKPHNLYDC